MKHLVNPHDFTYTGSEKSERNPAIVKAGRKYKQYTCLKCGTQTTGLLIYMMNREECSVYPNLFGDNNMGVDNN